jgi:multisubunit Na+/H+ antiporter MnhB subunit
MKEMHLTGFWATVVCTLVFVLTVFLFYVIYKDPEKLDLRSIVMTIAVMLAANFWWSFFSTLLKGYLEHLKNK